MPVDPICGKHIERQRAHTAIDFRGITYYLCCPQCQAAFERALERFVRSEIGERTKSNLLPKSDTESVGFVYTTIVARNPMQ